MNFHCSAKKWTSITRDVRLCMAEATDNELPNNRWSMLKMANEQTEKIHSKQK